MNRGPITRTFRRKILVFASGGLLLGLQCPLQALLPLAPDGDAPPVMGACLPDEPDCEDTLVIDGSTLVDDL